MAGDVEPEELFFENEALRGGEIFEVGGAGRGGERGARGEGGGFFRRGGLGEHVHETVLAGGAVAGVVGGGGHGAVDAIEDFFAQGAAEIEGAGFGEVFEDALVDGAAVDAGDEIVEGAVGAFGVAFGDDFLCGEFADAFDAGEAEADFFADGREHFAGFVDVGPEDFEAHGFAFGDEVGNFFGIAQFGAEHGGHELDRVVGFEETGLVAENGVGGRVGFIETVAGEFVEDVEDRVGGFFVDLVHALGAFDEFGPFLGHGVGVFFTHGAAEHVGAAEGVAGDDLGGFHDLLLVDHDAVGLAADFLEEFVRVSDGGGVFFPADVVGNPLHRAGAVEGDEGDDLVDRGKADLAAEVLHAAGFKLEDARGAAGVEQGEGLRVFERDGFDVEFGVGGAADVVHGVGDDGERLQAQEVHLQ